MANIRIRIADGGIVKQETVSILEDLFHDYEHFVDLITELKQNDSESDVFLIKRYERTAFILLITYFEGVINRWLKSSLTEEQWKEISNKNTPTKIDRLIKNFRVEESDPIIAERVIRNKLIHLDEKNNMQIYDQINLAFIKRTEQNINHWMEFMETRIGIPRHIDTRKLASEIMIDGNIISEGYSKDN